MKLWRFGGNRRPKPFTCLEYWLYLPKKKLPPQAAYMARMQRINPFQPGEPPVLTNAEAGLFSDIRLHIHLILREKNAHVFRPDLFESHVEPTEQALSALADAESFVKLQYLATEGLNHDKHLRFMPYLVEAIAELTKAKVVFDVGREDLATVAEFKKRLGADQDARSCAFHTRVVWIRTESGGYAATRGLVKIGIPELETPESATDHRVIITEVLELAAEVLWNNRSPMDVVQLDAFGDVFEVRIEHRRKGASLARILRRQN